MSDKKLDLSSILNKQNSPEKKEPEKVEIQDEVIIGDKQESKKEDITEMEEKSETEEAKKINSEFGTLNKQETKIEEKGKDSVLNQVQDDSSEGENKENSEAISMSSLKGYNLEKEKTKNAISQTNDEIGTSSIQNGQEDLENIVSKVTIDDVIDSNEVKDENSEIFENYKSDFDIKNEEIVDKELEEAIKDEKIKKEETKDEKVKKEETKKKAKEIKKEEKTNLEGKKKPKKEAVLWLIVLLIWIVIIGITYYFRDDLKNLLPDNKTPIIDNEEENTPDDNLDNNNEEEEEEEEEEEVVDTEKEIDEYIEQIHEENPELTEKEIEKLIKEKIIEIYLRKQK